MEVESEKVYISIVIIGLLLIFIIILISAPVTTASVEVLEGASIVAGTSDDSRGRCIIELEASNEKVVILCGKQVHIKDKRKILKIIYSNGNVDYELCDRKSVRKECFQSQD